MLRFSLGCRHPLATVHAAGHGEATQDVVRPPTCTLLAYPFISARLCYGIRTATHLVPLSGTLAVDRDASWND